MATREPSAVSPLPRLIAAVGARARALDGRLFASLTFSLLVLATLSGGAYFMYAKAHTYVVTQEAAMSDLRTLVASQQAELTKTQAALASAEGAAAAAALGSTKAQAAVATLASSQDPARAIATWRPAIAAVLCQFRDTSGASTATQAGSGTLISYPDGTFSLLSNKHVFVNTAGVPASDCTVRFNADPNVFTVTGADLTLAASGTDAAYASLKTPDAYLKGLGASAARQNCSGTPQVGTNIVILGYPTIGARNDITATNGIVSGVDGDYLITSAKVEHGNSGGAAIDVTRNCYLGIPTYVESDALESLARVLTWQAI